MKKLIEYLKGKAKLFKFIGFTALFSIGIPLVFLILCGFTLMIIPMLGALTGGF